MLSPRRWLPILLLLLALLLTACAQPGSPPVATDAPLAPAATGSSTPAALTRSPRLPAATASSTPAPPRTTTPAPTETLAFQKEELLGTSVAGRELRAYRFGQGPTFRLIIAGIHGGYESNTTRLAEQLIAHLEQHPEALPEHISLFILPLLNPDGAARPPGPDAKGNANQVDLNRNFSEHWEAGPPKPGCWSLRPITAGSAPFSEPESQAVRALLERYPFDALISYHSAGPGIFAGGRPEPSAPSVSLAKILSAASAYRYPPRPDGCDYTGQLIDWAAAQGLAALDIELPDHSGTDLPANLKLLERFLNW